LLKIDNKKIEKIDSVRTLINISNKILVNSN